MGKHIKRLSAIALASSILLPLEIVASQAFAQANLGFSISVDGETIAGSDTVAAKKRRQDVSLDNVDIQVKFDGLDVDPILNVSTVDLRSSYRGESDIEFIATTNYSAWISSSELRIYKQGTQGSSKPFSVVAVSRSGKANWQIPDRFTDADGEYYYVLRVYDQSGRFDETLPLNLTRTSSEFPTHSTSSKVVSAGRGEDRTSIRNIPVYGGAVTIFGRSVPDGVTVTALGETLPVDREGSFLGQQILPPGIHSIDVDVSASQGNEVVFSREVNIPHNEWFYVGLAELTFGKRLGFNVLAETALGEFDSTYSKGRLAFYLKGKIQGKYILTASADTGEDELKNIFRGLDEKDPRSVLRRIDPDDFYPVYGDDSTAVEDAPTQGKFYVRLERGDSHVMWGNYKTHITGSKFIRSERALYGAQAVYRSEKTTIYGERKVEAEAYASQPDTLPQRDEMRGTGGSAYFLTRQDISRGSETVSIQSVDLTTGQIATTRVLQEGIDYRIDYIQGVIILNSPLASTGSGGDLISSGALGDHALNLVVQYEYTPTIGEVDGFSYGGRAQAWVGNHVRVGVSGMHEETGLADNRIVGADIHMRLGNNSYVEAEIAESKRPGFGRSRSINGGLTINSSSTSGVSGLDARAYSLKGQIDLSDIDPQQKGIIGAYYEKREKGFTSLDHDTAINQRVWGAHTDVEVNENLRYRLNYEDFSDDAGKSKREGNAEIETKLSDALSLRFGAKHTALENPLIADQNGERTDLGAKLTYAPDEDNSVYVFGQKTVYRDGNIKRNDRLGVGGETKLTEKVGAKGEVSYGTSGWGGLAALTYDPTVDDHYYVGYQLDPDRAGFGSSLHGTDMGGIVAGAKRRHSEELSTYVENNYDMFGRRRAQTTTYGVIYTPDAQWTTNGGFEYGDIQDPDGDELTRTAVSLTLGYKNEETVSWKVRGEARFEDSDNNALDRDTYLASANFSYKQSEDWRFIANLDAVISNNNQSSFLDGDYIEGSLGYAYRPIDNDRLNALFKYTYLYDLPGPDQITVNNGVLGPAQRSHVLSADFIYDLSDRWSIGAKYGFRIGEVSDDRTAANFTRSSAHLGVLRADYHLVKNWDIFLEARALKATEIETVDFGLLAGVYRHVGENMKIGVGYNFGRFSDDITDLTHDDGGVFLNIIGKF